MRLARNICSGGSKGSAPSARPLTDQIFLNFMQFLGKIWQICMLAPLLEGWRPLLREILDPPLICVLSHVNYSNGSRGNKEVMFPGQPVNISHKFHVSCLPNLPLGLLLQLRGHPNVLTCFNTLYRVHISEIKT